MLNIQSVLQRATSIAQRVRGRLATREHRLLFSAPDWSHVPPAAGRQLYEHDPVFRAAVDACTEVLAARWNCTPPELMHGELRSRGEGAGIRATMVQLALIDRWRAAGVVPSAVIGDGSGELVAAYAAGALRRDDAIAAICSWSDYDPVAAVHLARAALEHDLGTVAWLPPSCPVYSSAVGGAIPIDTPFDATYWTWTLSSPGREGDAIAAALADGYDVALHMGNNGTRTALAVAARHMGRNMRVFDSLGADESEEVRASERVARQVRTIRLVSRTAGNTRPPTTADTLDLNAPDVLADPLEHFETLRREGSVHYLPVHDFWIVLGHREVQSVLSDQHRYSSSPWDAIDAVLLGADQPEHTAVRRLVTREFSPAALDALVALAATHAATLVRPELDVVADFAVPLANRIAARIIGADEELLDAIVAVTDAASAGELTLPAQLEALHELAGRAALHGRLCHESPGLIGDAEARSLVRLLWLASTTTTPRIVSRCVLRLLQHDALRREVQRDQALLQPFIEEVLRLHPAELYLIRRTTEAVTLGGMAIPAGATVQLCIAAANRDPACFQDPAALVLDRPPHRQLTLGHGVHYCVGAPLARRLVHAELSTLFREMPEFRARQPLVTVPYFRSMSALTPRQLVIVA